MKDIEVRADIVQFVDAFYAKVLAHPTLAPHFDHVNWTTHKPIMYSFWSSMILGEQSYKRNPFEKHMPLRLQETDFTAWLTLFKQTADELFVGDNAIDMKQRAETIAQVWQFKLGISKS